MSLHVRQQLCSFVKSIYYFQATCHTVLPSCTKQVFLCLSQRNIVYSTFITVNYLSMVVCKYIISLEKNIKLLF